MQTIELWGDFPGHEQRYQVSNFGRLRSKDRVSKTKGHIIKGMIIKPYQKEKAYMIVRLQKDGKKKEYKIHRMVGFVFLPLVEGKTEIHHKDYNKTNNHVDNLQWVTSEENIADAVSKGKMGSGGMKISVSDVLFIRDQCANLGIPFLSTMFNISKTTIYSIATGRARTKIKSEIKKLPKQPAHTKKIIHLPTGEIFKSPEVLSNKIGISIKNIRRQLSGERYNNQLIDYRYVGMEDVFRSKPPKQEPAPRIPKPKKERPPKKIIIRGQVTPSKPIVKLDRDGKELDRYKSIGEATRVLSVDKSSFRYVLNGTGYYKGFYYKREIESPR